MSDKRYPTRMHEVLGVELGERFQIKGHTPWYDQNFFVDENGDVRRDGWSLPFDGAAVYLINHPELITRSPRLTEEQILALNAAVKWFGFKWLVKDKCESVCFWQNKPEKRENHWSAYGGGMYADIMTVKVDNLVSWSDPAPLDIVQVLRQNGEEVEG